MVQSLNQIIHNFNSLFQNSYHQICDVDLRFSYVGDKFIKLLGVDKNKIIGYNLSDIRCPIQHLARSYYELNYPVLARNMSANYATVAYMDNEYLVFTNNVSPIIIHGENKGIIIESHCYANNIINFGLDVFSMAAKGRIMIHDYNNVIADTYKYLNEVEELITFLITIGKGDKEISGIFQSIKMYISSQAISKIITRKLYVKLQVDSRSQLINKVFKLGMNNMMPRLLVKNPILFQVI